MLQCIGRDTGSIHDYFRTCVVFMFFPVHWSIGRKLNPNFYKLKNKELRFERKREARGNQLVAKFNLNQVDIFLYYLLKLVVRIIVSSESHGLQIEFTGMPIKFRC